MNFSLYKCATATFFAISALLCTHISASTGDTPDVKAMQNAYSAWQHFRMHPAEYLEAAVPARIEAYKTWKNSLYASTEERQAQQQRAAKEMVLAYGKYEEQRKARQTQRKEQRSQNKATRQEQRETNKANRQAQREEKKEQRKAKREEIKEQRKAKREDIKEQREENRTARKEQRQENRTNRLETRQENRTNRRAMGN